MAKTLLCQGLVYIFVMGLINALFRVFSEYDINSLAYVVQAMLIGSFALIVVAGPGRMTAQTVRSPLTWLYGLTFIAAMVFYYLSLSYASATEATLLNRIAVPLAVMVAFVVFRRKTELAGLIGLGVVLLGYGVVLWNMDSPMRFPAFALTFLYAMVFCANMFFAEVHPTNKEARNKIEKMRVTGLVIAVTSIACYAALLVGAFYQELSGVNLPLMPTLRELFDIPTLAAAFIYGVVGVTVLRFLEFTMVSTIKTENVLAIGTLVPFTTLLFEKVFNAYGLLDYVPLSSGLLLSCVLIVAGNMMIVLLGNLPKFMPMPDETMASMSLEQARANVEKRVQADREKTKKAAVQPMKAPSKAKPVTEMAFDARYMDEPHILLHLFNTADQHHSMSRMISGKFIENGVMVSKVFANGVTHKTEETLRRDAVEVAQENGVSRVMIINEFDPLH